jgi:hypothetical protein
MKNILRAVLLFSICVPAFAKPISFNRHLLGPTWTSAIKQRHFVGPTWTSAVIKRHTVGPQISTAIKSRHSFGPVLQNAVRLRHANGSGWSKAVSHYVGRQIATNTASAVVHNKSAKRKAHSKSNVLNLSAGFE